MKPKKVQKSDFDVKKWGIFTLFVIALIVALAVLLKPAGEERAKIEIERAVVAQRKAKELAKTSNSPKDLAAVDLSTDSLDKARSLIREGEYNAAIEEAQTAVRLAESVLDASAGPVNSRISLVEYVGEVVVRKHGTSNFSSITRQTRIDIGDELRTTTSACTLAHEDGCVLTLRHDSQLTLEEDIEQSAQGKLSLYLTSGSLAVNTASDKSKLKLLSAAGKTLTYHNTSALFRTHSGGSELEILVRSGRVDALVGNRSIAVVANQRLTVSRGQAGAVESIPAAPRMVSPVDSIKFAPNQNGFASTNLVWEAVPGAEYYTVEISGDPLMVFLTDEKPRFAPVQLPLSNLKPGSYFWRVTAIDHNGVRGSEPDPMRFDVNGLENGKQLEGGQPPRLTIDQAVVQGQMAIIHGTTNVDATVKLNGEMALVDKETGAFNHVLKLAGGGEHSVNIVAQRSNGSIAYKNLTFNIKD